MDSRDGLAEILPPLSNNPPDDITILRERLEEETGPLAGRRDELLASVARAPAVIEDDDIAGRIADLIKLIMACHKNAEAARVSRKEPFLASGRAVDGFFKAITDPLEKAKKTVEQRLTVYQRKKAEDERRVREAAARAAQEEADRQRRAAEAAAAALKTEQDLDAAVTSEALAQQASADADRAQREATAKAADLSRTRGTFGSVASLRTFWDFEILDIHSIPLEVLRPHLPIAAVEQAVRSFVKANQDKILLPGVRIFQSHNSVVR